jgi:hypothetical protein
VKITPNFYGGNGTVGAWKWFRLWQNRNPSLSPSVQGEQDSPCDTRYIIGTVSNNPPRWGGLWSANVNDCGGSVTGARYSVKFSGSQPCSTCGFFESIQEWDFSQTTGELINPTPQNWHTIEWHYKLNTGTGNCDGTENGVYEVWIDGVKQTALLDIKANDGAPTGCTAPPLKKYGIGINTFILFDNIQKWTVNWSSSTYIYIDNVVISTSYIGPNYVVGSGSQDTTPPSPPQNLR